MSLTNFSSCARIFRFLKFYSLIHVTPEWLELSLLDAPSPRRVISSVLLLALRHCQAYDKIKQNYKIKGHKILNYLPSGQQCSPSLQHTALG